jgi:hypothetical protein
VPVADPAAFGGDVWTSTDAGATWTDQTASGRPAHGQAWRSVASDSSGTKLVAVTAGLFSSPGAIWTSTDSGATWTNRSAGTGMTSAGGGAKVASDAIGKNLLMADGSWAIWASTDGGSTWTNRAPVDAEFLASYGNQPEGWQSVACDATGTKLVVGSLPGDVWMSSDGGVTWRDLGSSPGRQNWISLTSDATGTHLVGIEWSGNGDIWTSSNGGLTWTDQASNDPMATAVWAAVTINAPADHEVAVARGAIWTN